MARASYIAQAARRAVQGVPALMPPSALLVRWQKAAPVPQLESTPAPFDRVESAAHSDWPAEQPSRTTPSSFKDESSVAAVPQHVSHRRAAATTTRGGQLESPEPERTASSVRAVAAPAETGARPKTPKLAEAAVKRAQSAAPFERPAQHPELQSATPAPIHTPIAPAAPVQRPASSTIVAQTPPPGSGESATAAIAQPPNHRASLSAVTPAMPQVAPPSPPAPVRTVLAPPAPPQREPVGPPPAHGAQQQPTIIRIGSVEVQITPAVAPPALPAHTAAAPRPRSALSRDLISTYGLRQG